MVAPPSRPVSARRITRLGWPSRLDRAWPPLIALATLVVVAAMLDPAGDHPGSWDGPGMTVDESINVGQGVALADRLLDGDFSGFCIRDRQLPDYPPAGRTWLGLWHELAFLLSPPIDAEVPYSITCARTGSAVAFAATVFLVGWFTSRWYGPWAGALGAVSIVLMPRVFGHAHLASLETITNLVYSAAVFYIAHRFTPAPPGSPQKQAPATPAIPGWKQAAMAGLLLGLVFVTKIQAVLLPVPISLWVLFVYRKRAPKLIAIFGVVALAVFIAGWPYLWENPVANMRSYFGRTTDRAVINVWYEGQAMADRDVPWHYPWVIWLTTVPVGLHLLGACGFFQAMCWPRLRTRALLLVACIVFPLVVFSLPGVPVYDGERLFLVSYPLWGTFIGQGADWLRLRATRYLSQRLATAMVTGFVALQAYGLLQMSPCWLSYYNALVGGVRGAQKLGLPVTYWGDGVTRELLDDVAELVPKQRPLASAPTLHREQWNELQLQAPLLRELGIRLVPLGSPEAPADGPVLIFMRREYLPEEFRPLLNRRQILAGTRRGGVWLAALCRPRAESDVSGRTPSATPMAREPAK